MPEATVLVSPFRAHPIRTILLAAPSERSGTPEGLVGARSLDNGSAWRGVSLSEVSSTNSGLRRLRRVTGLSRSGARGLGHSPSRPPQFSVALLVARSPVERSPGAPEKAVSGGRGLSLVVHTLFKVQDRGLFFLSYARNDLISFPEFVSGCYDPSSAAHASETLEEVRLHCPGFRHLECEAQAAFAERACGFGCRDKI